MLPKKVEKFGFARLSEPAVMTLHLNPARPPASVDTLLTYQLSI